MTTSLKLFTHIRFVQFQNEKKIIHFKKFQIELKKKNHLIHSERLVFTFHLPYDSFVFIIIYTSLLIKNYYI